MALQDIIEKIERDGENEIAHITATHDAAITELLTHFEAEKKQLIDKATTTAERHANKVSERILSRAHHTAQFIEEGVKRKALDQVFTSLQKKLESMPTVAYQQFIEKHVSTLPHRNGVFHIGGTWSQTTRATLVASGIAETHITETPELIKSGGFIFMTDTFEVDCTFEHVVTSTRTTHELITSRMLFKDTVAN